MKDTTKLLRKAKRRWFTVFFIVGFVQLFSYTIIVPAIALLLRWLGKFNPLWIFLDDTRLDSSKPDGLAEDYRIYLDNYSKFWRWWGVLKWHFDRNKTWNLLEMFKIPKYDGEDGGNQRIEVLEYYSDSLFKANEDGSVTHLKQDGIWVIAAGLKFVPKNDTDDPWQVNSGDYISYKTSILGDGEMLYKTNYNNVEWIGWRYSSCKLKSIWWMFGAKRWVTKFYGTNGNRYSFKYKFQKDKPWK